MLLFRLWRKRLLLERDLGGAQIRRDAALLQKSLTMARDSTKNSASNKLNCSPIHLLHRAGQCAGDIFLSEMIDSGLTPRQYAVLLTVSENEGLSQTRLVEKTGIDRSTLADVVRRMLKKGLLQRRRTREDARAYAVKVTDEGRRALKIADPIAKQVDERLLCALPASQRDRFLHDLQAIVESLAVDAALDKRKDGT